MNDQLVWQNKSHWRRVTWRALCLFTPFCTCGFVILITSSNDSFPASGEMRVKGLISPSWPSSEPVYLNNTRLNQREQ